MRLLFLMTADAFSGRITKLGLGLMARGAGQDGMRILKRKLCIRVVERFCIKLDDIFVPSFVVCMAIATFLFGHFAPAAVETPIFGYVAVNFLMTGNTKLGFANF